MNRMTEIVEGLGPKKVLSGGQGGGEGAGEARGRGEGGGGGAGGGPEVLVN